MLRTRRPPWSTLAEHPHSGGNTSDEQYLLQRSYSPASSPRATSFIPPPPRVLGLVVSLALSTYTCIHFCEETVLHLFCVIEEGGGGCWRVGNGLGKENPVTAGEPLPNNEQTWRDESASSLACAAAPRRKFWGKGKLHAALQLLLAMSWNFLSHLSPGTTRIQLVSSLSCQWVMWRWWFTGYDPRELAVLSEDHKRSEALPNRVGRIQRTGVMVHKASHGQGHSHAFEREHYTLDKYPLSPKRNGALLKETFLKLVPVSRTMGVCGWNVALWIPSSFQMSVFVAVKQSLTRLSCTIFSES